jgi:hypothetical protein
MKFIISEQEKQRILEMHQSATSRQYLTEGVPNTTLTGPAGGVTLPSRTVCGNGKDYIQVSFIVQNTGTADAYLTQFPFLLTPQTADKYGNGIFSANEYNVTIGGKPSWGQADGQNSPKIPMGKKATVNMVIYTDLNKNTGAQIKNIQTLKTGTIKLRFNGGPIEIPVTFGGFMVNSNTACDAPITLPKGF